MRYQTPESQYLEKYFSVHHQELEKVKEELKEDGLDFMSVSSAEARFLQFFIKSFDVKSVVEIGSLYGYSALAMALVLSAEGSIHCFEREEDRANKIKDLFKRVPLLCKTQVHSGDALQGLKELEGQGPFDLVFIDANKSGYLDYLDWAEKNTHKGSLIIGDNTFLFGALWDKSRDGKISKKQIEVMNQFNQRLADPSRYDSILIPTLEGMTVARRRGN